MPWSNNTGGGKGPWGNPNGGGGGPWGGGPSGGGGGGGGNQPPDLEEMLRRGQDSIKKVLPGGGAGGGFSNTAIVAAIAVLAVGLWFYQSLYQIEADELGVELVFGKPKAELSEPGLHFHFWPVETVERVKVTENRISIGGTNTRATAGPGLMLSGDQNIVEVSFAALWQISDPAAYLFNVRDVEGMVTQVTESAMREVVGRRPAQDIFRDDKAGISEQVRLISEQTLESYGAGIQINRVTIEDVAPPRDVADAFDEVQRAEQDEDRFVEEANRYKNQKLGSARGEAAQLREAAAAYKSRVVKEAEGEAQRFVSIYEEYAKAPEVTRKRLFLETMERVLGGSEKVIVGTEGGSGQGVVPYLPLPEIQKRTQAARGN
ncbi:MAG: FtsH protease activity modulator HflK [Pseudomonadota bacterium]